MSTIPSSVQPKATSGASGTEPAGVITDSIRRQIVSEISGAFHGDVIGPDHPDYPKRRLVWNAMVDKHPGLILRCKSTSDVVQAVNAARRHKLHPSVRCGGHQVAGKGQSDRGLTIDLSGMRTARVDKEKGVVHVDGGCLLGDVDAETAKHGVIVPAGIMSETGVAGARARWGDRLVLASVWLDVRSVRVARARGRKR